MKKLPLFITICIVGLVAGAYFLYGYLHRPPLDRWDLVPRDAVLVYEKGDCSACRGAVASSPVWSLIEKAAFYHKSADSIRYRVNALLEKSNRVIVSVHVTKKDDFDFIYYLSLKDEVFGAADAVSLTGHSLTAREFNGVTIHEIHFGKEVFSYATIENVWVGSFTPFLLEDVIRSYGDREATGKVATFGSLHFSSIREDAGNLYLRLEGMQELFSAFVDDAKPPFAFGKSALLDIKASETTLTLNGFSTDSIDRIDYLLSIFKHQNPVPFGLKNLIPNRAAYVSSYGISDGKNFAEDLRAFVGDKRPQHRDTLNSLAKKYSIDLDKLYSSISDEVAVCQLESRRGSGFSKVLLIESADVKAWTKAFEVLGEQLSVDTVFYERYAQYEIREVPVYQFAQKLLWPFVQGFDHTYYTAAGNVIMLAEDIEELKLYLNDIDAEETWGRSVRQNKFLEATLLESNLSLYVNSQRFWSIYTSRLQPRWQNFVRENKSLMQSFLMVSVQFSHLNNSFYTNAIFTFKPDQARATESSSTSERNNVTVFERGILNLQPVRSHVNRGTEVLVQDSLDDLSLVGTDGKILWKTSLRKPIISDVTQVDFFNNGKLQYFFAAGDSLHIIDRLGEYVSPFPIALPGSLDYVSVIDYDNSKRYRFLVADKVGKIFMYDKDGDALEGWKPNDCGGVLASRPKHYRIKGRDYIIAVRKDGVVCVWNRRGEAIRNFPVDLKAEPIGDIFLERGNSVDDTYFVFVTRDGFRVRLMLDGRIQSKETLLKTSIRSTFFLVNEKSAKSYLIVQQDERQLTVTSADGKKVFSAPVSGAQREDVQYYDYGSGRVFITVRDRAQGLFYIYDEQGKLLTTPPVVTTALEIRPSSSDEITLFFVHGSSLVIQPL